MKLKRIMIVALLLMVILTIGAVSAADDNSTSDTLTSKGEFIVEHSVDDVEMNTEDDDTNGNFSELSSIINSSSDGSIIELTKNYVMEDDEYPDGISVNKSLTIDGKGHYLDANNQGRMFQVFKNAIFMNIIFKNGNHDEGGCVYSNECNPYFINCTFNNCNGWVYGAINGGTAFDCTFTDCFATSGGAIHGDAVSCTFINCRSSYGGAIYNGSAFDCTFIDCTSGEEGGAIYRGSAVNCTFIDCHASYHGGAISKSSAFDCTFIDCHSDYQGGAICSGSAVNCTFINNTARDGGAIYDGPAINCTFEGCHGYNNGGAMNGGSAENCTFLNCFAYKGWVIYGGSAINCKVFNCPSDYAFYSSEIINTSIFNYQIGYDDFTEIHSFQDVQDLIDNAQNDDTIILSGYYKGNSSEIQINKNLTIIGNNAILDAQFLSGIFNILETNVIFKNLIFINSFSDSGSGALNGKGVKAINCTFINTTANAAGGAIYEGSAVNCSFMYCTSNENGGAIYEGSAVNCSFMYCTSKSCGGAIYEGSAVDCSFMYCTSNEDGGAITRGSAVNCNFSLCSARVGGAIGRGSASKSLFVGCSAYAGGIGYFTDFYDCSIYNNSAIEEGLFRGYAERCIFSGNKEISWGATFMDCNIIDGNTRDCSYKHHTYIHILSSADITANVGENIVINVSLTDYWGKPIYGYLSLNVNGKEYVNYVSKAPIAFNVSFDYPFDNNLTLRCIEDTEWDVYYASSTTVHVNINDNNYAQSFTDLHDKIFNDIDGVMSLGCDYTFNPNTDAKYKDGIVISRNFTILGYGHVINAGQLSRIFKVSEHYTVKFINVTFVYGRADYGGAIYNGHAVDCTFINCYASGEGGAIYRGSAQNCVFIYNHAWRGGAVSQATITNCYFTENRANTIGGAVISSTVYDSRFVYNRALYYDEYNYYWGYSYGGAAADSTIYNSYFERNRDIPDFEYINFDYDTGYCSAVYNCYSENCIFFNNTSQFHGAVYGGTSVNCTFISCNTYSKGQGAGIYQGNAYYCTFINCSARNGGGMSGGNAYYCNFIDCLAKESGGGMYYGKAYCCNFTDCTAKSGDGNLVYGTKIFNEWNFVQTNVNGKADYRDCSFYHEYNITASDVSACGEMVTFNVGVLNHKNEPVNDYNINFRYLSEEYSFKIVNGIAKVTIYVPNNELSETITLACSDLLFYDDCKKTINVKSSTGLTYKSFTDLYNLITNSDNDTINLTDNYLFNPKTDDYYRITNGINIDRNLTINGNNHILNAYNMGRMFNIADGVSVTFKDLSFVQNGREYKEYTNDDNYKWEINYDYAIYAENADVTVINSKFDYGKGAIHNGNAINCTFTNMSDTNGGAMYGGLAINCTFIDCRASNNGGAIYTGNATNCTFINCYAFNNGGAIYSTSTYSSPKYSNYNSVFINCAAGNNGGGAFSTSSINCTFRDCSAGELGGAMFGCENASCTVINCSEGLNYQTTIIIDTNSMVDVKNAIENAHNGNTIIIKGNYMYTSDNYIDIKKDITIIGNDATINSMGKKVFYCTSRGVVFKNIMFIGNNFKEDYGSDSGAVHYGTVINCTFINFSNKRTGGAVHTATVNNCTFVNCSAYEGGAVFNCNVYNSIFVNCSATYGGAAWGGYIYNSTFLHCSAEYGGAIYEGPFFAIKLEGDYYGYSFTSLKNHGSVDGSTFIDCSAIYGGAIYNGNLFVSKYDYEYKMIKVSNSVFINCFAKYYGGGVCDAYCVNSTFINCSARCEGGAIFEGENIKCTFINCTDGYNSLIKVYVEGDYWSIESAINYAEPGNLIMLNGNYSSYYWGIDVNKQVTIIGNNTVFTKDGESIFNINAIHVVFKNITFLNSNDVILRDCTAINCTFIGCSANSDGIINNGNAINCTFINCSANSGGLVLESSIENCIFYVTNSTKIYSLLEGYSPEEILENDNFKFTTGNNSTVALIKPFEIQPKLSISAKVVSNAQVNQGVAYLVVNNKKVAKCDVVNGWVNFEYTITKRGYHDAYVYYEDESGIFAPSITLAMESTKFNGTTQTFTELKALIDSAEGTTVVLNSDYEFDPDSDSILVDGISLKNIERIEGNGHKIDASGLARIFSADAKTLSLNNITFANGYHKTNPVMRISGSGSYEITDCIFINCTSTTNVGALHVPKQASMIIDNSMFMDITGGAIRALGTVSVNNSMFLNCHSESYGGAMYKGTAYDSTFVNCSSSRYGVIYSGLCYDCTFDNCTELEDANLKVEAHDINQSEVETVTVSIDKLAVGNVIVLVDDMIYPVTVTNGAGKVDISDLSVGEHTIYVTFTNDGSFKPSTVSTNITVIGGGLDSNLEAFVNDIEEGQDVQINVTINENVKGKVTVIIGEITENIEITNGNGSVNISGLTGGEYTAIVKFTGDDTFKASRKEMTFKVNKSSSSETNITVEPEIEIPSLDNVTDDEGIVVSLPADATGTVTLTVNGKDYIFEVVDGKADVKLPELDNGDYPYTITYSGDSKYSSFNSSGSLNVNNTQTNTSGGNVSDGNSTGGNVSGNTTVEPEITIPSLDETSEDGLIPITLPADATGTVTLTVGGKDYVFDVVNGVANVKLPDLNNGDYPYTITYSGDNKYSSFNSSGSLNVNNTQTNTSGGNVSDGNSTGGNVSGNTTVEPEITIPSLDETSEDGLIPITLPADATGTVTLTVGGKDYVFDVVNGVANVKLPDLNNGDYPYTITYSGDNKYSSFNSSGSLNVNNTQTNTSGGNVSDGNSTGGNVSGNTTVEPEITIPSLDETSEDGLIPITLPADATGTVTLSVDGKDYAFEVKNGIANVKLPNLVNGDYPYTITYSGDGKYSSFVDSGSLKVNDTGSGDVKPVPEVVVPPMDNPSADGIVTVTLPADATGSVTFTINGKDYVFNVKDGVADVKLPDLTNGDYPYTVTYSGDSKYSSFTNNGTLHKAATAVDPVITASNVKVTYSAGSYYTITVYGTDGKPANTTVKISGKISKTLTATKGIAKFKVTQVPGTYKITITALGKSVTKTITVKHLVTLKTTTIKKSAKKLTLQATLAKVNGKYLKNKKIIFKINGKKVAAAKTNKKGVAKITIKTPNVVKKLKVGKKVTYQATYSKDTVKKTTKIKK